MIPVFAAWHSIACVKLHHSLKFNHILSSGILSPFPQIQIWPPWGQTGAAAVETPLQTGDVMRIKKNSWWFVTRKIGYRWSS